MTPEQAYNELSILLAEFSQNEIMTGVEFREKHKELFEIAKPLFIETEQR